ncbi:putative sulfate exporter family transporter [Arthrobacter sp. H5]|uniref:YeiH family protein n=1 Tax=Arthrobacter sp. H5 TaxID=1267973 RepID=UPI0004B9C811|nr:putative sulfate exporter family transporter [Arthrobacter sp. H5]
MPVNFLINRGTIWTGLALCTLLGLIAAGLGMLVPAIGGPVFGIALGVLTRRFLGERRSLEPGIKFSAKTVLQAAVVLLGAGLALNQIAIIGWSALPVMLGTLTLAMVAGPFIGKWLRIGFDTRTLITVGTGICGASAIATISAVIGASQTAIAISVTVIFVYNILAVLLFPAVGNILGMSQESFGLWAGTAINDTSSVVAAATIYGAIATSQAVVVKLTRTLMIIPISIGHAWRHSRTAEASDGGSSGALAWTRLVPPFLLLFLLAAALNTVGFIPDFLQEHLNSWAAFFTAVALSAVGLSTPIAAMREAGWRPLALGGILWVLVAVSAVGIQLLTGQL